MSKLSLEAKYCALGAATLELQWLLYLVKDFQIQCTNLPIFYYKNQSALAHSGRSGLP